MSKTFKELYLLIIKHSNQSYQFFSYQPNHLGEADPSKFVEIRPNIETLWSDPFILFHDQEPINLKFYNKEWNKLFDAHTSVRIPNILSNSEKNSVEKDYVLSKGYVDFYWFSNAFLALDWYKNYQYFPSKISNLEFKFSCFNRLIDNRQHRLVIAAHLIKNYANDIILTLPTADPHSNKTIKEIEKTCLSKEQINLIDCLDSSKDYIINSHRKKIENLSYEIDEDLLASSFCHIVTETLFFDSRLHLTEKIFRPIVGARPFILAASPFSLKYLKEYGFKTFEKYWDESYDTETDHSIRLEKICSLITYIGNKSITELSSINKDMISLLEYNKNHFFNEFQKIISNELILNLEDAITKLKANRKNSEVSDWILSLLNNTSFINKVQNVNFTGKNLTTLECQGKTFNMESLKLDDLRSIDLEKNDTKTLNFLKVIYEIGMYLKSNNIK